MRQKLTGAWHELKSSALKFSAQENLSKGMSLPAPILFGADISKLRLGSSIAGQCYPNPAATSPGFFLSTPLSTAF